MKEETVASIKMLALADPETSEAQVDAIVQACRTEASGKNKAEVISADDAREMLGVSRVTMSNWCRSGKLHPIRVSARIFRFAKDEIESIAYGR